MPDRRRKTGGSSHSRSGSPRRPSFEWFSQAIAAGALILLVGGIAYVTSQPLIYPALGPSAFLQAEFPFQRFALFRDSVIGHLIAVLVGAATVVMLGVGGEPTVGMRRAPIPSGRIEAAALTVVLVVVVQTIGRVSSPPSTSVGLMFALGFFGPHLVDIVDVMGGVLLIAAFGVVHRRALTARKRRRRTGSASQGDSGSATSSSDTGQTQLETTDQTRQPSPFPRGSGQDDAADQCHDADQTSNESMRSRRESQGGVS